MCAIGVLIALAIPATAVAKDASPRIVGGGPTTIDAFPWQVALVVAPNGKAASTASSAERASSPRPSRSPRPIASSTTTGPQGICLPTDGFTTPASAISTFVGRTNLSSNEGAEIPVSEIYYFEPGPGGTGVAQAQSTGDKQGLYDCNTSAWDVALLQLASPAPPPASPIKIAGPDETAAWAPGAAAVASGWGALVGGRELPRAAACGSDQHARRLGLRCGGGIRVRTSSRRRWSARASPPAARTPARATVAARWWSR